MNKIDIVLASNNKGKIREIKEILKETNYNVISLEEAGITVDIEEDGKTFEENALKKATVISKMTGKLAMGDDSGLAVDALGGRPGVYSARYAGENATDDDRINKLLEEMKDKYTESERAAGFICTMAMAKDGEKVASFTGECKGYLLKEKKGEGGFGYDPIFVPKGHDKTFSEISAEEKNKISHRGKALEKLYEYLRSTI